MVTIFLEDCTFENLSLPYFFLQFQASQPCTLEDMIYQAFHGQKEKRSYLIVEFSIGNKNADFHEQPV